jgi:leader peptidase (prepilin peptidase)/N-methyltransferase
MDLIIIAIAICCILVWAGIIDFKESILPNELVVLFLACSCLFHVMSDFEWLSYEEMLLGVVVASGIMLVMRYTANFIYKSDTLGLGDVKLLAASGALLGVHYFMMALAIGAAAGVAHGIILMIITKMKTGSWPNMSELALPAGPGFIFGVLVTAAIAFHAAIF